MKFALVLFVARYRGEWHVDHFFVVLIGGVHMPRLRIASCQQTSCIRFIKPMFLPSEQIALYVLNHSSCWPYIPC